MISSCLAGCMGYAIADDDEHPTVAQIVVGDFCFFAGKPSEALAAQAAAPILTPQNEACPSSPPELQDNTPDRPAGSSL